MFLSYCERCRMQMNRDEDEMSETSIEEEPKFTSSKSVLRESTTNKARLQDTETQDNTIPEVCAQSAQRLEHNM